MTSKIKKVCVVTTTRADYGVLYWLMKRLKENEEFDLQIVASGTHYSELHGMTYKEIENDGFHIDVPIKIDLNDDQPRSLSLGVSSLTSAFSKALEELNPDTVVILGDRFEMLGIASVCTIYRIPVVHFNGGELTEGAIDDQIRHALTKLSHVHFTSTESFRKRVIKLGEFPDFVYNIGTLGSENMFYLPTLNKKELEEELSFTFRERNALVTLHPETGDLDLTEAYINGLIKALEEMPEVGFIITYPNTDTGSKLIIEKIQSFSSGKKNVCLVKNLGQKKYLSALVVVDAVVGNSSSGIVEVPSYGIPTVNIGDRQKGREMAKSIIQVGSENLGELKQIIESALTTKYTDVVNPYQRYKQPSIVVINYLKEIVFSTLIPKKFFEV